MITTKLIAKCVLGHRWVMTEKQLQLQYAQSIGLAMCPLCGNVATIKKIEIKKDNKYA